MAKQLKTYEHHYPSDVTNEQWAVLEPLLELDPDEPARVYSMRDIMDALFYLDRTGCAWRYLPGNLPPWQRVQYYFYKWVRSHLWEKINRTLARLVRVAVGKRPELTAGSIDSQSVKTTEKRGMYAASTLARRSKAVSDTYSLIHLVSS